MFDYKFYKITYRFDINYWEIGVEETCTPDELNTIIKTDVDCSVVLERLDVVSAFSWGHTILRDYLKRVEENNNNNEIN